jgi:hypothetical protein
MDYNYGIRHKDLRWFKEDIHNSYGNMAEDSSQTSTIGEKQAG